MPTLQLARLAAVASLAATALAQQSLRVPSQFPTIQAALAAAAPGDEVLLETRGPHLCNRIDKGISLRGTVGYPEVIPQSGAGPLIIQLPPGQQATIDGILFHSLFSGWRVRQISGTVTFHDCSFRSSMVNQRTTALEVAGGNAVLVRCIASGGSGGDAVVASGGRTSITACSLAGGYADFDRIFGGGVGLRVANGAVVQAAGCTIRGGDASAFNGYPSGHGCVVRNATAFFADCTVEGGSNASSTAGHGIEVILGSRVEAAGTSFTAGTAGSGGQAIVGNVQRGVPLLRPMALPPLTPSQPWVIPAQTRPHSLIAMVASTRLTPTTLPSLAHPLWVDGSADVLDWSVTDASGQATLSITLPASLPQEPVWVQLVSWDAIADAQSSVVFSGPR